MPFTHIRLSVQNMERREGKREKGGVKERIDRQNIELHEVCYLYQSERMMNKMKGHNITFRC